MEKKYVRNIVIGSVLVAALIVLRYSGIEKYINLATLKEHRDALQAFARSHYLVSVFFYITAYILVAALSVPIAGLMSLLGGFLFGIFAGAFYINIGATVGATLTFLLFRHLLGNAIQKKYSAQLVLFNKNVAAYGKFYLLMIRCTPLVPFFLVNILASWTQVSVGTFAWTTSLGIIPASLVYAYAGQQLGKINTLGEIFSWKIGLLFAAFFAFGLVALLIKKYGSFKQV